MFRLLCLLAVVSVVLGGPLASPTLKWDERILGGSDANPEDAPYQVSLRFDDDPNAHKCGASIISDRWILCAAHCTFNREPSNFVAVVGSLFVSPTGRSYLISQKIDHSDFNPKTFENDIAVLQTAEDIEFGAFVQPVPLTETEINGDELATLTGWGVTSVSKINLWQF
jgi:trypsin